MKRLALALFTAVCTVGGGSLHAQDSLLGTYSGTYLSAGGIGNPRPQGVQLTISSEEAGLVKGTAKVTIALGKGIGACSGDYPMEGKFDDGRLVMKSTSKSGSAGDCSFGINVAKEGNKLVGATFSGRPLELSR